VTAGRLWDEAKNLGLLAGVRSPVPVLIAGEPRFETITVSPVRIGARLLGHLAEGALLELFRQSAIYICCSQYEPFGLAPLEAALCGCAVLAHDIPSLREVWSNGALYFANATSLSELLTMLAYNPVELAAARQRSYSQAQQYSAARMTDQYIDLYRGLLTPPGRLCNAT
jgi:glycogen(starch) synthase